MPTIQDFILSYEDGNITLGLSPPVAVGGMSLQFSQFKRKGGVPISVKSLSPGFVGVSGMTILNSGQGILQIKMSSAEVSGLDEGAYFYLVQRTDSGAATILAEGYRSLY